MKKYHYYNATEINLQQKICFDKQKNIYFWHTMKRFKQETIIYLHFIEKCSVLFNRTSYTA